MNGSGMCCIFIIVIKSIVLEKNLFPLPLSILYKYLQGLSCLKPLIKGRMALLENNVPVVVLLISDRCITVKVLQCFHYSVEIHWYFSGYKELLGGKNTVSLDTSWLIKQCNM